MEGVIKLMKIMKVKVARELMARKAGGFGAIGAKLGGRLGVAARILSLRSRRAPPAAELYDGDQENHSAMKGDAHVAELLEDIKERLEEVDPAVSDGVSDAWMASRAPAERASQLTGAKKLARAQKKVRSSPHVCE